MQTEGVYVVIERGMLFLVYVITDILAVCAYLCYQGIECELFIEEILLLFNNTVYVLRYFIDMVGGFVLPEVVFR